MEAWRGSCRQRSRLAGGVVRLRFVRWLRKEFDLVDVGRSALARNLDPPINFERGLVVQEPLIEHAPGDQERRRQVGPFAFERQALKGKTGGRFVTVVGKGVLQVKADAVDSVGPLERELNVRTILAKERRRAIITDGRIAHPVGHETGVGCLP